MARFFDRSVSPESARCVKTWLVAAGVVVALLTLSACCTPLRAEERGVDRMRSPWLFQGFVFTGLDASHGASSSSGFFNGSTSDAGLYGLGFTVNYKIGTTFVDRWRWSLGATVDWMGEGEKYHGTGGFGAFPVVGSGRESQWDLMVGPRAMTHVGRDWTVATYARAGVAWVTPSGAPLGPGGPSYVGTATAPTFRIGLELDRRWCWCLDWKTGLFFAYQYTGPTDYGTTLFGERFRRPADNRFLAGLTVSYDAGDGPAAWADRKARPEDNRR